jgi:hypothetical protein
MSIQEDQELRERLDALLGGLEPRPAPVALAMRQGTGIRLRRWGAVVAGLAFVASGAAVLPTVLHTRLSASPARGQVRYSVTVHEPGKDAHAGLIAYGTENGISWQVVISGGQVTESQGSNETSFSLGSVSPTTSAPVAVLDAGVPGGSTTLAGPVVSNVTRVAITLPGGRVLVLTPVSYLGQRFVAIVIPTGVPIVRAVAYDGNRELAYSVPYDQVVLADWWRPGRSGPARFTKKIVSGILDGQPWRYVAQFGPWGYCYASASGSECLQGTKPTGTSGPSATVAMIACGAIGNGRVGNPLSVLASVPGDVRLVALQFSGGSTDDVPAVDIKGVRMIGYVIPDRQRVVRARTYNAAGRMVQSTAGVGLSCPA